MARKTVATTLLSYPSLNMNETNLPKTRLWSQYYQNDISTQVFILLGKARKKIKTGNITEGIALYFKGLRIAKTIPHPTGIIDTLNDSAWYMRHRHPHWALRLAVPQIRNDEIRISYDKRNAFVHRRKKRPCKEIFGKDAKKEDEDICSKLCRIDRGRP